jgi:hypothetical protein
VRYGKSFDLRRKNEDDGEANGVRPEVRFAFLNYANLFQIIIYENGRDGSEELGRGLATTR